MKKIISFLLATTFLFGMFSGCAKENKGEFNLETAKIGVMTGSTGERYVDSNLPNAKKSSYSNILDAIVALEAGKIDAAIMADTTAINAAAKNNDLIAKTDNYLIDEPICIGVKKDNNEIFKSVDDIISKLKIDGTLEDMKKRWIKTDGSQVEPANIQVALGESLKVGVAPGEEPFCYIEENSELKGFDIELANRIALELNRKVEFVQMDFSALIASLQSGKVDILVSLITATEERKKAIDFTQTYYESGQIVLMKK